MFSLKKVIAVLFCTILITQLGLIYTYSNDETVLEREDTTDTNVSTEEVNNSKPLNINDTFDLKTLSDEQLNERLLNSTDIDNAYFIQKLSKDDLALILKKDTILLSCYNNDTKQLYYEYLLNINLKSARAFEKNDGYFRFEIKGNGLTTSQSIAMSVSSSNDKYQQNVTWTGGSPYNSHSLSLVSSGSGYTGYPAKTQKSPEDTYTIFVTNLAYTIPKGYHVKSTDVDQGTNKENIMSYNYYSNSKDSVYRGDCQVDTVDYIELQTDVAYTGMESTNVPAYIGKYTITLAPNTYTLTYDGNGGSTPEPTLGEYNNAWGTLPTPEREGYDFLGWYTARAGGTQVTSSTKCTSNITLYASWKSQTEFYITKSQEDVVYAPIKGTLGKPWGIALNDYGIYPGGYHANFAGWYTKPFGWGGDEVTAFTICTGDLTIYPRFASGSNYVYTLRYDVNGGEPLITNIKPFRLGTNPIGELPTPERDGYDFLGWFNAKEGGKEITKDFIQTSYISDNYVRYDDLTIYARWKKRDEPISVRVPVTLIVGDDGKASFNISSDIKSGTLKVTCPEEVSLKSYDRTLSGSLSLDNDTLTASNQNTYGSVVFDDIKAGSWNGNFTIGLDYKK